MKLLEAEPKGGYELALRLAQWVGFQRNVVVLMVGGCGGASAWRSGGLSESESKPTLAFADQVCSYRVITR